MKVLVTGGCGFLGSHVVDLLVERGHDVLARDDLSTAELLDGTVPRYRNSGAVYFLPDSVLQNRELAEVEGFVHLALRHPLERERALYFAAYHGYVRRGAETVFELLNIRAPLKRVVLGGLDPFAYHRRRNRDLPALALQEALSNVLEYWHRPPALSVHLLKLPELTGERRPVPYPPNVRIAAPVEAAAAEVAGILEGKPRKRFEQYLPERDVEIYEDGGAGD